MEELTDDRDPGEIETSEQEVGLVFKGGEDERVDENSPSDSDSPTGDCEGKLMRKHRFLIVKRLGREVNVLPKPFP